MEVTRHQVISRERRCDVKYRKREWVEYSDSRNFLMAPKSSSWLHRAIELWTTWRRGIPDDCQNGLELGTFRAVSCPAMPKFEPDDSPKSVAVSFPTKDAYSTSSSESQDTTARLAVENSDNSFVIPSPFQQDTHSAVSSPEPIFAEPLEDASSTEDVVQSQAFQFLIRFANRVLPASAQLPSHDLPSFLALCADGVVPCLLLNSLVMPDMVDMRALNFVTSQETLSFEERYQNQILCLNSFVSVSQAAQKRLDAAQLAKGETEACLELLWRIVRAATVEKIDVHRFPELRALQGDDEDIFHFLQLSPQELLLRWVQFTLEGSEIENVSSTLITPFSLLSLQICLHPELSAPIEGLSDAEAATEVLQNGVQLGIDVVHTVEDLISQDPLLNSIWLSELFSVHSGLSLPSDSKEAMETEMDAFDDEGSREERTFRMWLNSLGCESSCANLFSADFRSGWMLLEVIESIQPGCIDWSKSNKPPFKAIVNRIKSVENCNQVIEVAKSYLSLSLVGIGGDDIADGKRKPILAIVWQLLRLHTLMILNSALESSPSHSSSLPMASQGDLKRRLNEADLLAWANNMLDFSGSHFRITSFKDSELSNSLAFLDLLRAIEPHAIQEKHITPGMTPDEKEMNAKYLLSVARKLGATIFIIWEDITEVKPKMLLLLIASFMLLDRQIRRLHKAQTLHHHKPRDP